MSEIGIKSHLRRLGDLLRVRDVKSFSSQLDTTSVKAVLDIGQGGFMERGIESAETATASVAGTAQGTLFFMSKLTSDAAAIQNNDGADRRVMSASARFLWAGDPAILLSWRWYLKADPDSSAEVDIAYAHRNAQLNDLADAQLWIPIFGSQNLACTWRGIVPAGWSLLMQWWSFDEETGLPKNMPAGTNVLRRLATVKAPAGLRLPY